ncbi:receptor-like protein EIX2 [Solanum verrucosum]|uniref:receptor-like protein EIX2 n=1 Tax=Solanum verrucosum TaxID=315347 RepID=UPI0020D1163C|nr:receptor-like protein EIX2 [Solanum verrucosum]
MDQASEEPIFVNVTRFSSLKKLYLQKNVLNGFFMERVGQVSSLEYLGLFDNQMRGPLLDLAWFPSLRELHLGTNQFQGRIPQGIGKLSQLRILDVSSNRLDGLPEIMGQLSNLEMFDASNNEGYYHRVPLFKSLQFCRLRPILQLVDFEHEL